MNMTGLRRFSKGVLVVAASLSLAGCIAIGTNGKITSSMGLTYPLRDVEAANERALDQLGKLPTSGKLDAGAVTGRDDSSFQSVRRLRGAAELTIGSDGATPDTPELPSADRGSLASDRVSAIGSAPALLKEVTVSPFDLITNTRDIYESLIPAELRFKFESLRRNGYEFFHVPISITVTPGTRTDENYAADVRFMLPYSQAIEMVNTYGDRCRDVEDAVGLDEALRDVDEAVRRDAQQVEGELDGRTLFDKWIPASAGADGSSGPARQTLRCERIELASGRVFFRDRQWMESSERFKSFQAAYGAVAPSSSDAQQEENEEEGQPEDAALELFTELSSLSDIRVFSISPLRVTDQRARTLERRIQSEEAMLIAASGPIPGAGAAAGNASADRIRRWERNLATITQEPLTAGYMDGTRAFGWRFYPRIGIDEDGDEVGRFLRPGPRDLMVIIALKRNWNQISAAALLGKTPAQWVASETLPEILLWVDYMPRWIETRYHLFLNDEQAPDNYPETNYFEAQAATTDSSRHGWKAGCYFEKWEDAAGWPRCGSQYLVLPHQPKQPTLWGATVGVAADKDHPIKSATLVRIDGDGFSGATRVTFSGKTLEPKGRTRTSLFVKIDPSDLPASRAGKKAEYALTLLDGPGRIETVSGTVWVEGAPAKPSATIVGSGLGIAPGQWVKVLYRGVPQAKKTDPKDAVSKPTDVEIRVGQHVIAPSAIVFTKANAFGFPAPVLQAGESSVLPVLVRKTKGTKAGPWLEAGPVVYASAKNRARAAIGVEVQKKD